MRACEAPGCDRKHYCQALCTTHYQRMRRTGRLDQPSIAERLATGLKVQQDGCWLWSGAPDAAGYGRISIGNRLQYVHRISYEHHVGTIPAGLSIDHLCRVRLCANPAHLEPVTLAENTRRENLVRWNTAVPA